MLTLAIIQLAHLFIAKHVIEYGAFCGARAALVGLSDDDARQAAAVPISTVCEAASDPTAESITIPGWDALKGSRAALERTGGGRGDFSIFEDTDKSSNCKVKRCELTHSYKMIVPVGNTIVYGLGRSMLAVEGLEKTGDGTFLLMKGSCTLAYPWGDP